MCEVFCVVSGEQADIEMQVNRSDDDLKARSLLYASRLFESQLGRGERFKDETGIRYLFSGLCPVPPKREGSTSLRFYGGNGTRPSERANRSHLL